MPDNDNLLRETHDTVIELKTTLLGMNGDEGLFGEIKKNTKEIKSNRKDLTRIKIILGVLLAAGGLTGAGIAELIGIFG